MSSHNYSRIEQKERTLIFIVIQIYNYKFNKYKVIEIFYNEYKHLTIFDMIHPKSQIVKALFRYPCQR